MKEHNDFTYHSHPEKYLNFETGREGDEKRRSTKKESLFRKNPSLIVILLDILVIVLIFLLVFPFFRAAAGNTGSRLGYRFELEYFHFEDELFASLRIAAGKSPEPPVGGMIQAVFLFPAESVSGIPQQRVTVTDLLPAENSVRTLRARFSLSGYKSQYGSGDESGNDSGNDENGAAELPRIPAAGAAHDPLQIIAVVQLGEDTLTLRKKINLTDEG